MLTIVEIAVCVYVGLVVVLYFAQTRIIFQATREVFRTPEVYGWSYEDVYLPVSGQTTHGWFVPVDGARGTVLFSHGNAGNIANRLESVGIFRELGLNVLVYDYGGYGHSTGKPSEQRCYADAHAMWQYLTQERGLPANSIILFGRSLGGAVTADLATEVTPRAVIIESTFTSTAAVAQKMYPFFPAKFFIRHRFNTVEKVGRITAPLLVVHSPEDEMIPFAHGQELYARAPEPKTFLEIHGGHNDGFVETGEAYRQGLNTFLKSCE